MAKFTISLTIALYFASAGFMFDELLSFGFSYIFSHLRCQNVKVFMASDLSAAVIYFECI